MKTFSVRLTDEQLEALRHMAQADTRSVNGQIRHLIIQAAANRGLGVKPASRPHNGTRRVSL